MAQTQPSGCLVALFRLFGAAPGRDESPEALPYRRKDYLLTKAERSFLGVLRQAVGDEYLIFAKIRLADLVWIPKGTDSRQRHLNRVTPRHIDFVLCDHNAIRPFLAIELDDSSHARPDRRSRDAFVDSALAAAGLPLLRVPARAGYNVAKLESKIGAAIKNQGDVAPSSGNEDCG
ncbi:MAG: DUF2726 domain-containing protein [Planctomycetota bacterium]|nr:DUF2726 domain-containing protein [Planctomycetota bacterium]